MQATGVNILLRTGVENIPHERIFAQVWWRESPQKQEENIFAQPGDENVLQITRVDIYSELELRICQSTEWMRTQVYSSVKNYFKRYTRVLCYEYGVERTRPNIWSGLVMRISRKQKE
jgi:hypothetical protein